MMGAGFFLESERFLLLRSRGRDLDLEVLAPLVVPASVGP